MQDPRPTSAASTHLLLFKAASYLAAVFLFVNPLVNWPGKLAAMAAVPLAFALSHCCIRFRIRGVVAAVAALTLFGFGMAADQLIGGPIWISRWLGVPTVLSISGTATFGCLMLATIFSLRTLAARWPRLVVLEAAAIVAVVVMSFIGHRSSNIGQPRDLADWAFGIGYDPRLVLRVLGALTAGAVIFVLLRTKRVSQSLLAAVTLAALIAGIFALSFIWLPDRERKLPPLDHKSTDNLELAEAGKRQHPTPHVADQKHPSTPSNVDKNDSFARATNASKVSSSAVEEDHGDGQADREDVSFDPHDWPNHPKPMAIVTLLDDFHPVSGEFYFRQNAYSQFNGVRLVRAVETGFDADIPREFPVEKVEFPGGPRLEKIETVVPMTVSLIQPHSRPFGLTNVKSLEPRPNANSASFERTYFAESQVLRISQLDGEIVQRSAGNPNWTAAERRYYLRGPSDPRYMALADEILGSTKWDHVSKRYRGSAILRALSIRRWIEKNMIYSLQADHHEAADPVASFLFGNRHGYCVHVAHAMAYLLRAAGIPARVATGYAVDAGRVGSGSGILLQSTDLHAWCEIYIDGIGWTVIDAALERSESPNPPAADLAAQTFYNDLNRPQFDPARPAPPKDDKPRDHRLEIAGGLLLVLLMGIGLYAAKLWRNLAPRFAAEHQLYRVCYRAATDRLAEVGIIREFGETREEFARRVSPWSPDFDRLTAAHVRRSFAGMDSYDRAEWRALLSQTLNQIRTAFPRGRRLLRRANPFTWVAVR